ncbi:MAG: DUF2442 domain-containing protein [Cytophagaceae bacterium]
MKTNKGIERIMYIRDYVFWIRFFDGLEITVDLLPHLPFPVSKSFFKKAFVSEYGREIMWSDNKLDFHYKFLRELKSIS